MTFSLPGFDLAAFVRSTLDEDLGVGLPGGGHDVTAESVIPADARFTGTMDSRDAKSSRQKGSRSPQVPTSCAFRAMPGPC